MTTPRLSIVIPALNESANLARLLPDLATRETGAEVIVVDGGSEDDSREVVARAPAARWLASPRGRARQMNAGARASRGDVVLFLHADTMLPERAGDAIRAALADPGVVGGRFDVRLDSRRPLLAVVAWMMNQRSRLTGLATGVLLAFLGVPYGRVSPSAFAELYHGEVDTTGTFHLALDCDVAAPGVQDLCIIDDSVYPAEIDIDVTLGNSTGIDGTIAAFNVIVDNGRTRGAPVIREDNPILPYLIGRIEHKAQFGALSTDFTLIKSGSMHRANGGYLIMDAVKLLTQPFAWDTLKRTLRTQEIRIETPAMIDQSRRSR